MYSGIPISRTSKGNKNWFEESGVRDIWGKITMKQILVRVIERFQKLRVREIRIPLYVKKIAAHKEGKDYKPNNYFCVTVDIKQQR